MSLWQELIDDYYAEIKRLQAAIEGLEKYIFTCERLRAAIAELDGIELDGLKPPPRYVETFRNAVAGSTDSLSDAYRVLGVAIEKRERELDEIDGGES